jgi:hypothetical protein
MISRRLISVLLAALALACPFLDCIECFGTCLAPGESAQCRHGVFVAFADRQFHEAADELECGHRFPHHTPLHSQHGNGESDCLCKGAIVAIAQKAPDTDNESALVALIAADSLMAPPAATLNNSEPSLFLGSHFPPLLSGRDIRTLVSSYQQ